MSSRRRNCLSPALGFDIPVVYPVLVDSVAAIIAFVRSPASRKNPPGLVITSDVTLRQTVKIAITSLHKWPDASSWRRHGTLSITRQSVSVHRIGRAIVIRLSTR